MNALQLTDHKSTTVPNFYYTKPNGQLSCKSVTPSYLDNSKPARSIPKPEGERFSRRVRGMNIDPVPPLEAVEKVYKMSRTGSSPEDSKDNEPTSAVSQRHQEGEETCTSASQLHSGRSHSRDEKVAIIAVQKAIVAKKIVPTSSSNSKKKKNKCVWCKPRRKRPRFSIVRPSVNRVSGDEGAEDEMSHEEEMDVEKAAGDVHETDTLQLVVDTTEHEGKDDTDLLHCNGT